MEKIYVIGHLNPDTDTVVSAISFAAFMNKLMKIDNYIPAVSGKLNSESEFVLKKFNIKSPVLLEDAAGKKVYLVDHNEDTQRVKGILTENILGIVDHHKLKFECPNAIEIMTLPWGSTNSIIYMMAKQHNVDLGKEIKGAMLSAMLSDTIILKSPTTTQTDKMFVEEISKELGIDYKSLGLEQFKAKAQVSKKTAEEIIMNDFKEFMFPSGLFGVGQLEMPDLNEIESKIPEIIKKLKSMPKYHALVIMLTDIIKEGTKLVVVSKDEEKIAKAFKTKIKDHVSEFIPGMLSRKKQVAPILTENF